MRREPYPTATGDAEELNPEEVQKETVRNVDQSKRERWKERDRTYPSHTQRKPQKVFQSVQRERKTLKKGVKYMSNTGKHARLTSDTKEHVKTRGKVRYRHNRRGKSLKMQSNAFQNMSNT